MIRLNLLTFHVDVGDACTLLLRAVMGFALAAVLCAAAMTLDGRVLDNGHNVWLKPLRFCVAFAVHLVTVWWLASLTQRQALGDRWFGLSAVLQTGTAAVEFVCIAVQAARGVHSHFNYTTLFDHAIFTAMGLGTAVLLLGMVLMIAGLVRWPADRASTYGTTAGISIAVLGGLVGVWMVMPTSDQRLMLETGQRLAWVGSAWAGAPSAFALPFFGWDLKTGDWRVPHFIGLHAMQAVPVLAWLHRRGGEPVSEVPTTQWVGTVAYFSVFIGAVIWTATGRSALDASAGSAMLVGFPLAVFLIAVALLARRRIA